jgi:hypothetical protein
LNANHRAAPKNRPYPIEGQAHASDIKETPTDQPAFQRLRPFVPEQPAASTPLESELRYHTLVLAPDAPVVGQAVRELDLPQGTLLVTIKHNGQMLVPRGETVLAAGDQVTLFASPQQLRRSLAAIAGSSPTDDAHTPAAASERSAVL